MIKPVIKDKLVTAIQDLFGIAITSEEVQVDNPTVESFGDYTSNIAMSLNKFLPAELKQSPEEIAKKIVEKLNQGDNHQNFSRIEVAKPGFINFTMSLSYLNKFLKTPISTDLVELKSSTRNIQRVMIEYVGPNTNKPLHIGHLRNAVLGIALVNLEKAIGEDVIGVNINNDRGIHIIKAMYGYLVFGKSDQPGDKNQVDYKSLLQEWSDHPDHWKTPASTNMKPDFFVGQYYILGNEVYEQSEKNKEENSADTTTIYPHDRMQSMLVDWENNEPLVRKLWTLTNSWAYEGQHQTYKLLGVKSVHNPNKFFDKEWYESEIYKDGKDIVTANIGKGVIEECEDGHVEANLEKYNLPNIVLLRKNKTALYITQDIELLRQRINIEKADKVIYLTDYLQNLRFQQLFVICESIGISKPGQAQHLGYGTIRTPEGKMSSRKGNVILADDLINEVIAKAKEKINPERESYTEQDKDRISKQVALAAIKYGMLKFNALSNMIFDIEKNVSFEGDTGPYIQYTYARTASILRKLNTSELSTTTDISALTLSSEEEAVLRRLHKFYDIVIKSSHNLSPNYLCEYLFSLAQEFNLFYANKQIIKETDPQLKALRIELTSKTSDTLKQGLLLLGIEAPEKM